GQKRPVANGHSQVGFRPLQPLSAAEFLQLELPSREYIVASWLTQKGLSMVHSKRGVGKTHFLLTAAYGTACGQGFRSAKAAQGAFCRRRDAGRSNPAASRLACGRFSQATA